MKKEKLILVVFICLALSLSIGFGRVKTDSMEPAIEVGSIVFYSKVFSADSIEVGDIVLFKDSLGRVICHRVLSIEGDFLVTKGDALSEADPKISKEELVGKYLFNVF